MLEENETSDATLHDGERGDCQLIIDIEWEDHKNGWAGAKCACRDWSIDRVPVNRNNKHTVKLEALEAWRRGHHGDRFPHYGVSMYDNGETHTGQAHVSIEGDDHYWLALFTVMTKDVLRVKGFYHEVEALEDASEFVIPIHRVKYVSSYPWWDLEDVWVREKNLTSYD